ncbi:MAG TPA: MFS transporter [Myxococcales bacterium]|nr:MFS transporter [Myxococcales bacterium]HIL00547.1 MFS transporter [Myxococcales bacterium]
MVKSHVEESLGANPGDAALNPADSVAMGVPSSRTRERLGLGAGAFRALSHRPFRLLFISFLINQTGFWISHISLQGLMVELSNNDTRQNGLLFFVLFLPAFLLAPIAGVAADRFDRKKIVLVCYASVVLCCGVLATATASDWLTPGRLLAIAFALGLSFAFSGPASSAIAANAVSIPDLPSAVSLQSAANNLTRVVGPLLAAPLVATSRFEWSFALYMVAAASAAILTAAMRIDRYKPEEEAGGIFARMSSGFVHARERRPALPALITVATLSFFGVSHTVLIPAFAANVLGSAEYFAWLAAATGVGAMMGALRAGRVGREPSMWRAGRGMFAYGLALMVFALNTHVVFALTAQLVVGYFYFSVMTSLQTLIQTLVDESKRGRVMSLFQVAWAGLVPFGSLSMGFLGESLGSPITIFIGAGVCAVFGLGVVVLYRSDLPPRLSKPLGG